MNSSIEGRSRWVIASTVAVASSRVANVATRVAGGRCFGISRRIDLGDDPERPLRADEQLGQRQPGDVLQPRPAEPDRRPVGEHDRQPEHVVGGDAVLHAAQAAGVGGDVAADRADLVRRGVGRVPEVVLGRRRLHLGVHQPRLHDRGAGRGSTSMPVIRSVETTRQPVDRGRAAGQPGAGTAGHDGDAVRGREPHGGLDVLGRPGPHHRERDAGVGVVGAVPAVLVHPLRVGDDDVVAELRQQGSEVDLHVRWSCRQD